MRISVSLCIFVVVLFCGCAHLNSKNHYCQIRVGNRSSQPIRSVTLDPDGSGTGFGFLGGGKGGKTAAGCRLPFMRDFVIEWKENGKIRRSIVDLSIYAAKRKDVQSMSFYYLGDGKWATVAQSGTDVNSQEVKP